jgi:hypothetical protein
MQLQKKNLKELASQRNDLTIWTMDLQALLLCPKTLACAMYYKTKLGLHNLTFFELKTREVFNKLDRSGCLIGWQ